MLDEPLLEPIDFTPAAPTALLQDRLRELQHALHVWVGDGLETVGPWPRQTGVAWALPRDRWLGPSSPRLEVGLVGDARFGVEPFFYVAVEAMDPASVSRLVGPFGSWLDAMRIHEARCKSEILGTLEGCLGGGRASWWTASWPRRPGVPIAVSRSVSDPGAFDAIRAAAALQWEEAETALFPKMVRTPVLALGVRIEAADVVGLSLQPLVEQLAPAFVWCRWVIEECARRPRDEEAPTPPVAEQEERFASALGWSSAQLVRRRREGLRAVVREQDRDRGGLEVE